MNAVIAILICALMFTALFAGCSNGRSNASGNTPSSSLSPMPAHPPFPTSMPSIDEFHNHVLAVRAYASSGIMPLSMNDEEQRQMNISANSHKLGDIQYYYMPSWIPEGFELGSVGASYGHVQCPYVIDGFALPEDWERREEYSLNNRGLFSWRRDHVYTLEGYIESFVGWQRYSPVAGVDGLYYRDSGANYNTVPPENLERVYSWLQDGYAFWFSIPLRIVNATPGIERLILNSAMRVDVTDNVPYVAPASITLDKTTAELTAGRNLALSENVSPSDATIKNVIWNSGDDNVATVSQSGVVTGVSAGTTTITAATVNGLEATCVVTVVDGGVGGDPVTWAKIHSARRTWAEIKGLNKTWGQINPLQ